MATMQRSGTSVLMRASMPAIICTLLVVPFLFAGIAPLNDVPGHMGRAAVAAYAARDPALGRLMDFHWHLVPNLGADLIVEALRRVIGIAAAYWLVAAIIPPLLAAGMFMLARALNARGAAAIAWALIFAYCYPFNFGFLNYMLGSALALIGLAAWIRLETRPQLREAMAWVAVPLLFLCHAVAGCLFALFTASREVSHAWPERGWLRRVAIRTRPLLSSLVILLVWRLGAESFAGATHYGTLTGKIDALVMQLRDQDRVLDIGSVLAAGAVFAVGWRAGARPHRAVAPALLALLALFVVMPADLGGAHYADMRLVPMIPMLAFATQDWSRCSRRLVRFVDVAGCILLLLRLGVTTAGFIAYDRSYRAESAALAYIPEHSRIAVLTASDCNAPAAWRSDRLGHFGDLAIVARRAWTNSEWDTDGAHLLRIPYRPSPAFYDDPSQYVWPDRCGPLPANNRHRSVTTALALIPFDRVDFLWLIQARLPDGYSNPRLQQRWQHGGSTLFAVVR